MPIYEYRCGEGHAFEVMQRISDDPLERCEVCGKPAARVFHPPAVHFKGSGFYNTDYGTRKRAKEKEASGGEGGSGEGKSGAAQSASKDSSGAKDAAGSAGKSEAKAAA